MPSISREWLLGGFSALVLGVVAVRAAAASSTTERTLLLLGTLAPFVLMVIGELRRPLLALAILDIPLQWDRNLDYNASAASFSAIGGFSISLTTLALIGLYALWLADGLSKPTHRNNLNRRIAIPLAAYLLFASASIIVAPNKLLSSYELVILLQSFLLFIYVACNTRTTAEVRFVVALLVSGFFLEGLLVVLTDRLGLNLAALGFRSQSRELSDSSFGVYRLGGTVGSPNSAGSYFAFLLPLVLAFRSMVNIRLGRQLASLAFGIGLIALILTFSRGAWLAFAASLVALLFASGRYRIVSPRLALGAILITIALAVPFRAEIASRITGSDAGAASSRVDLLRLSIPMIGEHPILGVGLNNYSVALPQYAGPEFTGAFLSTVHNKFVLTWAETGIFALVALLAFLGAVLTAGFRLARSPDPVIAVVAIALTAGLVGQLIHMNVDIFKGRPQIQLLFLVGALMSAMSSSLRRPASSLPRRGVCR